MAEPKQKTAAKPKPEPVLAAAGESSDPVVHQLLAHLEIAVLNNDTEAQAAVKADLAGLGYAV
jgi:hypothetical protein